MAMYSKASVAGAAVTISKVEADYADFEYQGSLQLWCTGLDGGTFSVTALMPDGATSITCFTGLSSDDLATLDGVVLSSVTVTFAALGGAAAPVVYTFARNNPRPT